MTTDKENRAYRADQLLNDPILDEAFKKAEDDSYNELLRLPFWASDKKRRMLIDRINTIKGVKGYLRSVVLNGKNTKRTVA
ncbi:hypothetical protein [Phyllobacterium sophorae]|uniref:Uncharacterized protein n=1 Tax=Phyllobacterium sophorae TaxID=1520277 RepID=A0A2P7BE03_9HYPH|nr:hypothetical protein [Phyllobacterium sophorae]PSH64665.1 hypothetical protein CU103_12340 [Phyllobacterium sophorae]